MSNTDKYIETQLDYYQNNLDDYERKGLLHKTTNRAFKRKARIIANTLGAEPKNNVLEVGAGSGLLTYFLYDKVKAKNYVAQDLSAAMIDKAKTRVQKPGLRFDVGDATKFDYANNSYDALAGTDIIHHMADPVSALKEWLRVTKPGGRMCMLESNPYNPFAYIYIGVEHEARYFLNTDHNLKKWMETSGWKNVEVTPAPVFTPAGPFLLHPVLDLIDIISLRIPLWRRLTSMWIVTGEKQL